MRRFFLSTVFLLPALLLTTQCKPKAPENDESKEEAVSGTYKKKWFLWLDGKVHHYVYFIGADKGVGNKQCWYQAISKVNDRRREPEVMRQESRSLSAGFIDILSAQNLVNAEVKRLSSSEQTPAITKRIKLLNDGMKIMIAEKTSARGINYAAFVDSKTFQTMYNKIEIENFVESLKAVFNVAAMAIDSTSPCPDATNQAAVEFH